MNIRTLGCAAALVVAAGALPGPAFASPAGGGARFHPPSVGFAGWAVNGTTNNLAETTTIVLPKLKCGKAKQGILPGVGTGINLNKLIDSGMFVGCTGGKARYFPEFIAPNGYKDYPKLKAKVGDRVVLTEVVSTAGPGKLVVFDKTTKSVHKTLTVPKVNEIRGPWVGDWVTSGFLPVPDFGTINFSHTRYGGVPIRSLFPGHLMTARDRYHGSTLQIKTGMWRADGETFQTVFKHS
jgi:hypothetical protein